MKGFIRMLGLLGLAIVLATGAFASMPVSTQAAQQIDRAPAAVTSAWYGCVYTVRYGDDFFRLSMRYGVSPAYMMGMNGLYRPYLYGGMSLQVPCSSSYAPGSMYRAPGYSNGGYYGSSGYSSNGYYGSSGYSNNGSYGSTAYSSGYNICSYATVYFGDDLSRIAARYGMSWRLLAAVNHLYNPNLIYAGTRLAIPCNSGYNAYGGTGGYGGSNPYGSSSNPYGSSSNPYGAPSSATPAPTTAPGTSTSVIIQDFMFSPATLTVRMGQTVTWTNKGPSTHTTTSDSGAWDSGSLAPGKTFSQTFSTAGTFTYHCSIHPTMRGTIVVTQ